MENKICRFELRIPSVGICNWSINWATTNTAENLILFAQIRTVKTVFLFSFENIFALSRKNVEKDEKTSWNIIGFKQSQNVAKIFLATCGQSFKTFYAHKLRL